jgi:molybdopterin/thiamine biosynthesis adenylyltransferase
VIVTAAMMGVGKIRGWDDDVVRKSNLTRLLGATRRDIGKKKIRVLRDFAKRVATASPFEFDAVEDIGTSTAALRALKDCDVIFSCVDRLAPRVPLNDLAYVHLIPTLDMGSWIHEDKGKVDDFMTHAMLLAPGMPCARCTQKLSPRALTLEAQGAQRGAELRAGYGLDVTTDEAVDPSVLPLNLAGVSLAMLQFMQLVLRVTPKTPCNLTLRMPGWELDESDLDTLPDCGCVQDVALGDTCVIRPVERPSPAKGRKGA